jgi:hypothetical protein
VRGPIRGKEALTDRPGERGWRLPHGPRWLCGYMGRGLAGPIVDPAHEGNENRFQKIK